MSEQPAQSAPGFIWPVLRGALIYAIGGAALGALWSVALAVDPRLGVAIGAFLAALAGVFLSLPAARSRTREQQREMSFVQRAFTPTLGVLAVVLALAVWAGRATFIDGDGASAGAGVGELADRILRLGEDPETKVEVKAGEMPAGLQQSLNPGATDKTAKDDLVSLPVHPDGKLLGSFRVERPDGVVTYFLLYDVAGQPEAVEDAVRKQVNQSPWQAIGGQSSLALSTVRFQSTTSGDVTGTAALRSAPGAENEAKTSLVYIVEVSSPGATPPPFRLPAARALPEGFPPDYLLDGMTPISVQWAAAPTGQTYQLMLLTKQSTTDVSDRYRKLLQDKGWQLANDSAQGFATNLDFQKDNGGSQASLSIDAFEEDQSYTAVVFSLQLAR